MCLNFLPVGHTHEDVDLLFAILLALVLRKERFQTPSELEGLIKVLMATHIRSRGEELHVTRLDSIRDFTTWMWPQGLKLHSCWMTRKGVLAPHSFTYKLRGDLTSTEVALLDAEPTDLAFPRQPNDVFCIWKQRMHSTSPNGPPVLVLPESRLAAMVDAAPTTYHSKALKPGRANELHGLATSLEQLTEPWGDDMSYFRAAEHLRELANGLPETPHPTGWLEEQAPALLNPVPATQNPYFSHLPLMSWRMLVDFAA